MFDFELLIIRMPTHKTSPIFPHFIEVNYLLRKSKQIFSSIQTSITIYCAKQKIIKNNLT